MLDTIWATVQILWNDPVWSKVIAAGVLALIAAMGSYVAGLWPMIGAWLVSVSSSPRWFLLFLAVTVSSLASGVTWRIVQDNRVIPLEERVVHLEEQVKQLTKEPHLDDKEIPLHLTALRFFEYSRFDEKVYKESLVVYLSAADNCLAPKTG
jgi:hypothetical protein